MHQTITTETSVQHQTTFLVATELEWILKRQSKNLKARIQWVSSVATLQFLVQHHLMFSTLRCLAMVVMKQVALHHIASTQETQQVRLANVAMAHGDIQMQAKWLFT